MLRWRRIQVLFGQSPNIVATKFKKTLVQQTKYSVPVAVTKTGQATILNPDKQCPIHYKQHALVKCREFGMKTDEWKSLLKEHAICYKCCSSTSQS